MSISKTVKHAIRHLPNVEKVTFKTRKLSVGEAEFCTVKVTKVGTKLPAPGHGFSDRLRDNHLAASYQNEHIRRQVIDDIRAIVRKAYGWSAQTTSGGMNEWTIRLNSEYM